MRFGGEDGGVTIQMDAGVADVRLDRPAKLNALTPSLMAGIGETLSYLQGLDDLRCVVLSGEGRSFSAGMDLSVLSGGGIGALSPRTHGIANHAQHCTVGWRDLPVPVIAAVRGHCLGGGLQVALGADIRIAAPDARLSVMEMKHGLVPDMGLFTLLRGVVRADVLRELVYTARELSGDEAAVVGLVTRVAGDPMAEAMTLAREIAGKSPPAIRAAKRLFARFDDGDAAALLQAESDEQEVLVEALLAALKGT